MNTFTITLSDAEFKALSYVALDPAEWVESAVHNRCRQAMDQIYNEEVARMTADPNITTIPADKESVVLSADIQTAAERQAAADAELAAGNP